MSDVLKQVEEALDQLPALAKRWVDAMVHATQDLADSKDWEEAQTARKSFEGKQASALTTLRGLEWEELQFTPTKWDGAGASIGKWENGKWMVVHGIAFASTAHEMGFTHYCIPILPTPPKREGK